MAVSFPGFPWRFSRGGGKEKQPVVKGASLNSGNSSSDAETVKFQTKISGNGKWQGSEERRVIDKEFDVVVVPSDGIHLSGYESDGPLGGKNPSALVFMVMKMMVDTLYRDKYNLSRILVCFIETGFDRSHVTIAAS
ncbi:DNA ligase [Gossypium australe]|uniref:DNA ligase n=1 Tax=Gossypium australe TaxID=47621 RepID=A0A5B6W489_9ROSI|nr:DNA ligase [Gossypium australe]